MIKDKPSNRFSMFRTNGLNVTVRDELTRKSITLYPSGSMTTEQVEDRVLRLIGIVLDNTHLPELRKRFHNLGYTVVIREYYFGELIC